MAEFADIEADLFARVSRVVWATLTTVDTKGRPRSRIVHPYWEGPNAYVFSRHPTLKEKHLAANPNVALCYWDAQHEQVYAEGAAEWITDAAEKARIWEAAKAAAEPYGWDPGTLWSGPDDPAFSLLKIANRRIELFSFAVLSKQKPEQIWRA